jgi:hypothetical protein
MTLGQRLLPPSYFLEIHFDTLRCTVQKTVIFHKAREEFQPGKKVELFPKVGSFVSFQAISKGPLVKSVSTLPKK